MTNAESGRSMVEMLGVLAIIGVLSIGGIAGYTMAMNRYRANEIIDVASKVAVIGMSKQDSKNAIMNEATTSTNVSGATAMTGDTTGKVTITGNFTSGVQEALKSIAGNKVKSSEVSATSIIINFEVY